jgi:Uncharacterized conserved protein (DUF2203)
MSRHQKESERRQVIPIWTYAQAQRAAPYVASIMRSLRDHRLEAQRWNVRANKISAKPGRPNRSAIIAHEEALREARRAEDRFEEALQELQGLGVYCQDPIRGQALLPFIHGHLLAWFVFDLFEKELLFAWRYHGDPMETRRPIHEVREADTILV